MTIIDLPWRAGPRGYYAKTTSRRQEVESRMRQLIFVNPHERFMRNDLGVPMIDFIFEPVDAVFEGLAESHIRAMVHKWIDDIQITEIAASREEVETERALETRVTILIFWRDLRSGEQFESELANTYRNRTR